MLMTLVVGLSEPRSSHYILVGQAIATNVEINITSRQDVLPWNDHGFGHLSMYPVLPQFAWLMSWDTRRVSSFKHIFEREEVLVYKMSRGEHNISRPISFTVNLKHFVLFSAVS